MTKTDFPNFEKRTKDFDCSIGFAMTVIGSKWRAVLLWHILKHSPIRYGDLKRHVSKISHKVMSEELKRLEEDNLILRTVYPSVPPRVEYSATELGKTLTPALTELCNWGRQHMPEKS